MIKPYKEFSKINELFNNLYDRSSHKNIMKDLKIVTYGNKNGESFYVKDLGKNRKEVLKTLKEKLIGKRVQFYYDRYRGIDGYTIVKEIMIIKDVKNIGRGTFSISPIIIEFKGIPERGNQTELIVNKDYPITILPDKIIRYSEDDPFGEEDWGDVDESVNNDEEINFIPFRLREELNPDFIWDNEIENKCYYNVYKEKVPEYEIDMDVKYLNIIIEKLIGKYVNFTIYNYAGGRSEKKRGIINNIRFNKRNILVFQFNGNAYAIDERKPITSYVRKYNNELDPLGEEDWDD